MEDTEIFRLLPSSQQFQLFCVNLELNSKDPLFQGKKCIGLKPAPRSSRAELDSLDKEFGIAYLGPGDLRQSFLVRAFFCEMLLGFLLGGPPSNPHVELSPKLPTVHWVPKLPPVVHHLCGIGYLRGCTPLAPKMTPEKKTLSREVFAAKFNEKRKKETETPRLQISSSNVKVIVPLVPPRGGGNSNGGRWRLGVGVRQSLG